MGIELTSAAKLLLAKRGYDPLLGARPLRRTIQREIEDVLSEKILFGDVKAGEISLVDVETVEEKEQLTFSSVVKSTMPDTPGDLQSATPTAN
jgi:ATP-dependent Clp protease ATP-binding subunit ClpC